jgi:actin-related protein
MHNFIGIDESDRFPREVSIALVLDGFEPKKNIKETLEILFEDYDVARLALPQAAAMALVASGRSTGLLVDIGHSRSRVVPVFEGFVDSRAVQSSSRAGHAIDTLLFKSLSIGTTDVITSLKHRECFVASSLAQIDRYRKLDVETNALTKRFTLPDGHTVEIGGERVLACEEIMRSDGEVPGVGDLVNSVVTNVAIDVRRPLLQNVLLTGGGSELRGLDVRLGNEIKNVEKVEKIGMHAAFVGAATLAHTYRHFDDWWLTQAAVKEKGLDRCMENIIHF